MFKVQSSKFKISKICGNLLNLRHLRAFLLAITIPLSTTYGQSNRLTNEDGKLIWQYNQSTSQNPAKSDTIFVTFVFTNGINQTAISLRQEFFNSTLGWLETANIQVEKEGRGVEFLTANVPPHQSLVFKYYLKTKPVEKELILERSALLIMNEDFEIIKELLPEQKFPTGKK